VLFNQNHKYNIEYTWYTYFICRSPSAILNVRRKHMNKIHVPTNNTVKEHALREYKQNCCEKRETERRKRKKSELTSVGGGFR